MREKNKHLCCGLVSVLIHPLYTLKWIWKCMIQSHKYPVCHCSFLTEPLPQISSDPAKLSRRKSTNVTELCTKPNNVVGIRPLHCQGLHLSRVSRNLHENQTPFPLFTLREHCVILKGSDRSLASK